MVDLPMHQSLAERPFGEITPPPERYNGMQRYSQYLHMRDDVKLAITLVLPKNLPTGEKIPTLLMQTRYWREMELNPPLGWFMSADIFLRRMRGLKPFFTSHGYAIVMVDERGTGASFGNWLYPWHPETVSDARQIVDWIISQPWSNGRVGGFGISYLGTTAEYLATLCHPAVKAVIPMFNHPDVFIDIAYPGGVFNQRFIQTWDRFSRALDRNQVPAELGIWARLLLRGVKPVDRDRSRRQLRQALEAHASNANIFNAVQPVACRDETVGSLQVSMDAVGLHNALDALEQSETAIFGWGSWIDAGTGDAVLRRYSSLKNAKRAVIGAWEHGGTVHSSPYARPDQLARPDLKNQWVEMLRFFDAYLREEDSPLRYERCLHYYSIGDERWRQTTDWPPTGTQFRSWYLAQERNLEGTSPDTEGGTDTYVVDFRASTGEFNRWWELGGVFGRSVQYPNRNEAGEHMLVYTTPPLAKGITIAGNPLVRLYLSSSEEDGALFVYLEDIHPDGYVAYLTEGQLRLIHRKVSEEQPPYHLLVPYHSFKRRDVEPLVPGQVIEVALGLLPIAARIEKGHRLRIGIAGHDEGTFARLPASGKPTLTIFRSSRYPSRIEIPVLEG